MRLIVYRQDIPSHLVSYFRPREVFKPKDDLMIPHRVALALQADGWYVRQEIVWSKPNPMPESVKDRCTRAHETVFMLAKGPRYYYDADAVREPHATGHRPDKWQARTYAGKGAAYEPRRDQFHNGNVRAYTMNRAGRNKRSVWAVATSPLSSKTFGVDTEHYAAFPQKLVEPMILAGTSEAGCCPACGAPYRRAVERSRTGTPPLCPGDARAWSARRNGQGRDLGDDPVHTSGLHGQYITTRAQTRGWEPACGCAPGPPIPCTTLDPFLGSGTVAIVSKRLGRSCVGIELNEAYAEMARRRVESVPYTLFSGAASTEGAAR